MDRSQFVSPPPVWEWFPVQGPLGCVQTKDWFRIIRRHFCRENFKTFDPPSTISGFQVEETLLRLHHQLTASLTCHKPVVIPPGPRGDVFCWGAVEDTRQGEAPGNRKPEEAEISPEVSLLLHCPHHKWDVIVATPPLPHLKGRSFQHISVHHRYRAKQLPLGGEVCGLLCSPGRVLLPGDGLEHRSHTYLSRPMHEKPFRRFSPGSTAPPGVVVSFAETGVWNKERLRQKKSH